MLTKSDIERICKQVDDISCEFYSDEDWIRYIPKLA